mmetsp:Transcript_30878/g.48399  ORF Transcript_30878/g.48399 Transcript_30878/m.48399 type:complete len:80 (+) Transcript_30878:312-551(+)
MVVRQMSSLQQGGDMCKGLFLRALSGSQQLGSLGNRHLGSALTAKGDPKNDGERCDCSEKLTQAAVVAFMMLHYAVKEE